MTSSTFDQSIHHFERHYKNINRNPQADNSATQRCEYLKQTTVAHGGLFHSNTKMFIQLMYNWKQISIQIEPRNFINLLQKMVCIVYIQCILNREKENFLLHNSVFISHKTIITK